MRFSGRLTIPDDPSASVPVVLDFEDGEITVTSNDEQLGRYPGSEARLTTLGGARFQLGLGDEEVVFTPDDAPGFAEYGLSAFGHTAVEERPHVVLGGTEAPPEPSVHDWSSPWAEPVASDVKPGDDPAPVPWEPAPPFAEAEWEIPDADVVEPIGSASELDEPTAAGEPSPAALARMLAEAVIEVRDGLLAPERAHAMAALAAAYAQVAALPEPGV
jgi:hypothetical protein